MRNRLFGGAALLFVAALAIQCSREAPAPAAPNPAADMQAVVSIRELMTNIVDPLSDNIFDAVGVDVTAQGIVETKPTTDEDWAKVRQGAVALAEATNLLLLPRRVAPANDNVPKNPGELHPDEVQKHIEGDRAKWVTHVTAFRTEALKVFDIVDKRDTDALFNIGSEIDKACESCHLEYWYPGDREAVLRDRNSKVTITPPGTAPAPAPTPRP